MAQRIRIHAGSIELTAVLDDTPTAAALVAALPLEARAQRWGDEIYFTVPVKEQLDDTAAKLVEVGDLGYWPTGRAFCIFFGPTPISRGNEIRPASAVNRIGRVIGDATAFKAVEEGDLVRLEVET